MKRYQKNTYPDKKNTWIMWILLVVISPLGIIYMWASRKDFSTKKKTILSIIFLVWYVAVLTIGGTGSDEPEKEDQNSIEQSESEQDASVDLELYYIGLQDQKRALDDLIAKYESGEESPETSAEKLIGLSDGINNSIDAINGAEASDYKDALVSYATALKGIAKHYADYIKSGDQSELDDVNTLKSELDNLWQAVESCR